jgi:hypothetical protein
VRLLAAAFQTANLARLHNKSEGKPSHYGVRRLAAAFESANLARLHNKSEGKPSHSK